MDTYARLTMNEDESKTPPHAQMLAFWTQMCIHNDNFSQRKAIKIHLCLSILLHVAVITSSGITFGVTIADQFERQETQEIDLQDTNLDNAYAETVMVISSFCLCFAIIAMTVDCLALIGIQHVNSKLLVPWLLWSLFDGAILLIAIVVVMVYTQNALVFLLFLKIVWNVFIWFNLKDLYQEDYLACQDE
eukprot:maker-scaffold518_size150039-snap-gene-0.16 protein:Tk09557 transcript:maker-scaffold518_size150039-snap-gene-0.16-mRNA-1 annotation:"cation transport atpase"